MKRIGLLLLLLCGCQGIDVPASFVSREIKTDSYTLASWQKITDKNKPIRIYIEGDGYAFNHKGQPTTNPTPRSTFLRKIAFNDPNPNVVYLARVCQYVDDKYCSQKDWTTGRFSQGIVDATAKAIKEISTHQPVILVGYSGGALLSGLVIEQNTGLPVQKWITIAGVLNHKKWTESLDLPPLSDSQNLDKLPHVTQLHLVGDKDTTVSWQLTESLVDRNTLIVVPNATHNSGFERFYTIIYQ